MRLSSSPGQLATWLTNDARWHIAGQCIIALMVLTLFLPQKGRGLPLTLPVMAVIVVIAEGMSISNIQRASLFQGLGILTVLSGMVYGAACRVDVGKEVGRAGANRRIIMVMILLAAGVSGWAGGCVMYDYHFKIDQALQRFHPYWAFSQKQLTRGGSMGFDGGGRLNTVGNILSTDQMKCTLRVFCDTLPGYLRGAVFDRYRSGEWVTTAIAEGVLAEATGRPAIYEFAISKKDAEIWREMDIWPDNDLAAGVFVPMETKLLRTATDNILVDDNKVIHAPDLLGGINYQAVTARPVDGELISDFSRRKYLELSDELDERMGGLAEHLCRDCQSATEKIEAVSSYLRNNFLYQLGVAVPEDREAISYFLFDERAGHCEYFASAAALLLRYVGVPTRYVAGFVVDEKNPYGGYYVARNRDAHAWVEAWDDGRGKWVTVEATSAQLAGGESLAQAESALWEHIKFRFQQLRVAIHVDGVTGLVSWLGERLYGLLNWAITSFAGWLLIVVLLVLLFWRLGRWIKSYQPRAELAPELAEMYSLLAKMDRRLGRLRIEREAAETVTQFAQRLHDENLGQAGQWYEEYCRVRFGGVIDEKAIVRLKSRIPRPGKLEILNKSEF